MGKWLFPIIVVVGASFQFLGAHISSALSETRISHGSTLHGILKYPVHFKHFDYADPLAPKGGHIRLSSIGSFDSLNPFILKGRPAAGLNLTFETLMTAAKDEADSQYGLLAESIEVPDDLSWATYTIRPEARWHDGTAVTVEDVIFSFTILKKKGHPFYRAYYSNVESAIKVGPQKVRFIFSGGPNRELPHIIGQLTILPKSHFEGKDFESTTLEPIMGSGPYRVIDNDPGRSITYHRVKNHWGRSLPVNQGHYNFDRVSFEYYRDQTIALEAFKSKETDFRQENTAKTWATGYNIEAMHNSKIIKEEIVHQNPTGMQAFAFNIRRPIFQNPKVREALAYAFDFEWANKNLFYDQYTRTLSFFSNSELAATGLPSAAEKTYLEPHRHQIPPQVFEKEYKLPQTDGKGNHRANLKRALALLEEAGWKVKNGKLTEELTRKTMSFEILLAQPSFERITLPFVRNLARLGISARVRTVDTAQYQNRVNSHDFDMIVKSFSQSLSPGNEQRSFWGSSNANITGSGNVIGVQNPAIDDLIEKIVEAANRPDLIAATRALDRVLLWNHYVIPQWHSRTYRVAYWNRFSRPTVSPKYGVGLYTWWVDPAKDSALQKY